MTECSSLMMFLAWKSSWSFSWENGLLVVAVFMISWLAKQPNVTLSSSWLTKKIDWSDWVVSWPKLMIDYLWKDWLNQLTEWRITDYRTAFQMTSSWFVILVDYMSVLFYFFIYSETDGCISNLSCFSTPPLKKKGHNEEIPGKWLNWIIPCWCGRDFYWVPFISKSWYKTNQIS